ncbi:MAG: ribonuclease P protein component [Magnetococcales bacterium]|nr:ribonuclease P protein component [Magnetococcales bacterium]MBF0419591.1 ribonuclease P protein component [Magnetococcales bacterium]
MTKETKPFGFPPTARLHCSREFKHATDQGKKIHTPLFLAFLCKNGLDCSRLGVTVSKKIGQAVTRNRIKRWLRDYFRHRQARMAEHWDVVIIARIKANAASRGEFDRALDSVFRSLSSSRR